MQAKIVLIRPVYEENLGLVARAVANFGFRELALVKPECGWKSGKAKSRAMHGKQVLEKAKEYNSIEAATKDCAYVIATSAKKGSKRNVLSPSEIAKRFGKSKSKIALVFGPEPSGLTNAEIGECDFLAQIPASPKYVTLNLSHAVCIMLYQLFLEREKGSSNDAKASTRKQLLDVFEQDLTLLPSINNKKTVLASFKALSSRALLSEKEAKAMIAFLSQAGKRMRKS